MTIAVGILVCPTLERPHPRFVGATGTSAVGRGLGVAAPLAPL